MKRIAIQLFGHLRSFRHTHRSLRTNIIEPHLLEGYAIDVFLHTWTETDHSSVTWHNQSGQNRGVVVDAAVVKELKEYYHPEAHKVEAQREVENIVLTECIGACPRSWKGVVNIAYTKFAVNELRRAHERKTGNSYDYVIVTRPDIFFHREFRIGYFLDGYSKIKCAPPARGIYFGYNFFARGPADDDSLQGGLDLIYFGTPAAIDAAVSVFPSIENGSLSHHSLKEGFYSVESLWFNHWRKAGLTPVRLRYFQFSCFNIVRSSADCSIAERSFRARRRELHAIKVNALSGWDENTDQALLAEPTFREKIRLSLINTMRRALKILPFFLYEKMGLR